MDIILTINKSSEQKLLDEIKYKFDELKVMAYKNKNEILINEINSIHISGNHGIDFSEDTFFN